MLRQFTATAYVLDQDKLLLVHHRKYNKWVPPGGHMDPNEIPSEAAKREVLEETGMHVEIIPQENVWIDQPNAKSFERPFLCLIEEIPAFGEQPAHQHLDFIYLTRPLHGELAHCERESFDIKWFTLNEIEALVSEVEIFEEIKETARFLLGKVEN